MYTFSSRVNTRISSGINIRQLKVPIMYEQNGWFKLHTPKVAMGDYYNQRKLGMGQVASVITIEKTAKYFDCRQSVIYLHFARSTQLELYTYSVILGSIDIYIE